MPATLDATTRADASTDGMSRCSGRLLRESLWALDVGEGIETRYNSVPTELQHGDESGSSRTGRSVKSTPFGHEPYHTSASGKNLGTFHGVSSVNVVHAKNREQGIDRLCYH
jgi:hypothetical protein